MALFHDDVLVSPNAPPVALSNGSTATARVSNLGPGTLFLQVTLTSAAPSNSTAGCLPIKPGETLPGSEQLVNYFGGVGAGPFWLWGLANQECTVEVSHA